MLKFREELAMFGAEESVKSREELLPLFPLGVVLFPESALPLHIFEERYKILIGQSLEDEAEFGINLVHENAVSPVGCSARVREVLKRYDDGRMDIVVQGIKRFRILELIEDKEPYFVGKVHYHTSTSEKYDEMLRQEAIQLHNTMMKTVYRDDRFQMSEENDGGEISFRLAQKIGLELRARQSLLEMNSENERLRWLRTYLAEFLPKLENAASIEMLAQRDGYL